MNCRDSGTIAITARETQATAALAPRLEFTVSISVLLLRSFSNAFASNAFDQATHSVITGVSSIGADSRSSNVRFVHVASRLPRPLSNGQRSNNSAIQSTKTRTFGDR